jgi:hypothetical protein
MPSTHVVRAFRQPLTWLVVAAFVLLAMLALESTGSGHAPSAVPLSKVAQQAGDNNGDNPTKHCTDAKGKDADANKHCRAISQQ